MSNNNEQRQVVPYLSFPDISSMVRDMNALFERSFEGFGFSRSASYLERGEDAYILTVELQGYEKDEIKVTAHDGCVHVRAEHEGEGRRSTFKGDFCLPRDASVPEQVSGKLEKGILSISFPIKSGLKDREVKIE